MSDDKSEFNLGTQPIDELMEQLGLTGKDIVSSGENLTFKMVKKARAGRKLTLKIQRRILDALNAHTSGSYKLEDLFNYRGG